MKQTLDSFVIKNSKIKIKMEKKIGEEKKRSKGGFYGRLMRKALPIDSFVATDFGQFNAPFIIPRCDYTNIFKGKKW